MALNQNKTRNYSYVSGVLGETTQHHQVKNSIFIFKNDSNVNFPKKIFFNKLQFQH